LGAVELEGPSQHQKLLAKRHSNNKQQLYNTITSKCTKVINFDTLHVERTQSLLI